jgi:mannose-6-phosphate isomerase-like protein (cupin superfamily)
MSDGGVLPEGEGKGFPLPGARIVFKVWGEHEPGNHDLAEFTAEPGFRGPKPHIHRVHEELFYVLEGEFDFLVGDEVARVGPGGLVNVPPGVVHDFRNVGSTPARWLGIHSPGFLDRYFEGIGALVSSGNFSEAALHELRLNYDIDEVDLSWGEA